MELEGKLLEGFDHPERIDRTRIPEGLYYKKKGKKLVGQPGRR
jgi:hypothetical protein